MSLYPPKAYTIAKGLSEFDILKASHKFLRDDEITPNDPSTSTNNISWEDQLAEKYYSSLYREFALCNLKHYKTGNFALRWRTESEVLSGAGESTCANTRCKRHHQNQKDSQPQLSLTTLELPFVYTEHGESKHALVKVVLCPKCVKKLMWKRQREKEKAEKEGGRAVLTVAQTDDADADAGVAIHDDGRENDDDGDGSGGGASEDGSENSVEEVVQKAEGKGREKGEGSRDGGREGKDPRPHSKSTYETEERTRKKRHRGEIDNHSSGERRPRRRRGSRSRSHSPRRASHHSHSRKRSHSRPKGDRNI